MTTDDDSPRPAENQSNAFELSPAEHETLLNENGGLLRGLLARPADPRG